MAAAAREQIVGMEKHIAWLRVGVVLLTGAEYLRTTQPLGSAFIVVLWEASMVYAAGVLLTEPYCRMPLRGWHVISGLIDWGFITLGIVLTGGGQSDLYLLYFLSVLSIALRYGPTEVVMAGLGTAVSYVVIVLLTAEVWPVMLRDAALRMGYLLLFAVGSGVLAREARRQFHARMREEARRVAVQEVTATVSHDLKNPLAAVTGLVEMLLDSTADVLTLDQRALLHRINANTRLMTELVGNLLEVELIECGRQAFQPAWLDLNALVRRVVEAQAHQAEEKHIGLVLDLNPQLPAAMLDGRSIERLVANLLGNAVKFTPHNGAIRVSTRCRDARVIVEVWDSGPDIPASLHPVLFEQFTHQSDSPGVGLGLYICKSIVEMHAGTISVDNPAGGGVLFVAELPVSPTTAVTPSVVKPVAPDAADLWQPHGGLGRVRA
jgi:K+-sensing histidine kinase KdpD